MWRQEKGQPLPLTCLLSPALPRLPPPSHLPSLACPLPLTCPLVLQYQPDAGAWPAGESPHPVMQLERCVGC